MELRQLRYFLAVVEAGAISAASRQIHVAQPALTRQIRLLEEDLETRLFDRHARGVQLTVTGHALAREAQDILDRHDQIKERLKALGQGQTGKLSLGITVTQLWDPQIARLLSKYRRLYNGVAFEVFPLLSGPQLDRLRQDKLDVGILYLDDDAHPGLETCLLHLDHLVLAVPEASAWAKSPPTSLDDVKDADFIWGFRRASPPYHDRMMQHFRNNNFNPRIVQYGAGNIAILSMVSAGLGLSIVPATSSWHPIPGIRFLSLPELDRCDMPLRLAWKPDNDSPTLTNFISLVRKELA